MSDFFIFTEIVRCGQIGTIALRSFYSFHPNQTVHVFGLESDRDAVLEFPKVIFHSLDKPDPHIENEAPGKLSKLKLNRKLKQIAKNFDHGHLGTASLWAYVIQTRPEKFIIHFDSDVVFRAPALKDITSRLSNGYDIAGSPRPYKNNPNNRDDVRHLPDLTQTLFFGFNKQKISTHSYDELTKMCQGLYNPLGDPVIDFFDPVELEIIKNKGRVHYLSTNDYGGADLNGSRENKFKKVNSIIDFGDKLAHFSAVGSGMNFYLNRNKIKNVPDSYLNYGLEKYAVYMKLFYKKDIDFKYDKERYQPLFDIKKWF